MSIEILYANESQKKLKNGVDKLANAVKQTLGPKGKYVIIDKSYGSPLITNDGVTVAREIEFSDKFENMGAKLINEVSSKTEELSGDGTTTACVLTQKILDEGLKNINNGYNSLLLKNAIDELSKKVVKNLQDSAIDVDTDTKIENIASISAKDKQVGKLIADAVKKATADGVITISEAKGFETTVDITTGYHFDNGYVSNHMITDEKTNKAIIENPIVAIFSEKINNIKDILPLLELIIKENKPLIIMAQDFSEEVISTVIMNKMRGILNATLIKNPSYGDKQLEEITDITKILNTKILSTNEIDDLELEQLGSAVKFEVSKNKTIIVSHNIDLTEYVAGLKENADNKQRIAKLVGGIGVINVGANTESELKEKKSRIDDALRSTYAAMEEGIVQGGGIALLKAVDTIEINDENEYEKRAYEIIKLSVSEVVKQIIKNAGYNEEVIFDNIVKSSYKKGFNAMTGEYQDLIQKGVVDAKKNIRVAFENAVSIATLILLTGVSIAKVDAKDEDKI